jgi:hypothetical protein
LAHAGADRATVRPCRFRCAGCRGLAPLTRICGSEDYEKQTLRVNAAAQNATLPEPPKGEARLGVFGPGGSLLVGFVVVLGAGKGRRHVMASLSLVLIAMLLVAPGCGGGGSGTQLQQQPPPPNLSYYSVLVSGTANGIVHNAKVIVAVQ